MYPERKYQRYSFKSFCWSPAGLRSVSSLPDCCCCFRAPTGPRDRQTAATLDGSGVALPLGDDGLGDVLGAAVLLHHQPPDLLGGVLGTKVRGATDKATKFFITIKLSFWSSSSQWRCSFPACVSQNARRRRANNQTKTLCSTVPV